jgi:hypothetical protein
MANFKGLFGVIIVIAVLLSCSVPSITPLATADDVAGEPEERTLYEAGGIETRAEPMEEIEPEEDTSGELGELGGLSVRPAHMVLEDALEIGRGEPVEENIPLSPGWQTIMSDGFEGAFPGVWSIYVGAVDA